MTLFDYLSGAFYGNKDQYGNKKHYGNTTKKKELMDEYKILSPKMSHKVYFYKDNIIFHILVPSRVAEGLFYDVIIDINKGNIPKDASNINGVEFECFSNCPSFTFTYAKVFQEHGILSKWLYKKYNKGILNNDPDSRNPKGLIDYERSLYLAIKYILDKNRSSIRNIEQVGTTLYNTFNLYVKVKSQSDVARIYARKTDDKTLVEKAKKKIVKLTRNLRKARLSEKAYKPKTSKTPTVQKTNTTTKTTKTTKTQKTKKTKKT